MNVRKVIGMVLLSFGIMASVSASYTDDLKQKYADGSFYIEYQVTRQDAKGEIAKNQNPVCGVLHRILINLFMHKKVITNIINVMISVPEKKKQFLMAEN